MEERSDSSCLSLGALYLRGLGKGREGLGKPSGQKKLRKFREDDGKPSRQKIQVKDPFKGVSINDVSELWGGWGYGK